MSETKNTEQELMDLFEKECGEIMLKLAGPRWNAKPQLRVTGFLLGSTQLVYAAWKIGRANAPTTTPSDSAKQEGGEAVLRAISLLRNFQSCQGSRRGMCDEVGREIWDECDEVCGLLSAATAPPTSAVNEYKARLTKRLRADMQKLNGGPNLMAYLHLFALEIERGDFDQEGV